MRDGSAWSPYLSTRGGSLGLADGEMAGPRLGPRLFQEIQSPTQGGSYSQFRLTGIAQSDTGVLVAGAVIDLYDAITKTIVQTTVSDALGAWSFTVGTGTQTFYVVVYKAGPPDSFGTSVNTLTGV